MIVGGVNFRSSKGLALVKNMMGFATYSAGVVYLCSAEAQSTAPTNNAVSVEDEKARAR